MHLSPIEYIGSKPRRQKRTHPVKAFLLLLSTLGLVGVAVYQFGIPQLLASQMNQAKKYSAGGFIAEHLTDETREHKFLTAALKRTDNAVTYDPAYYDISYPLGDVPKDRGVCTDVVIRTYREIGVDLQQLVHEDMKRNFHTYPKNWNLKKPDTNIDHRRVPNLQHFFARNGKSLTISTDLNDFRAGDIVSWDLSHGVPHTGIVVPSPIQGDSSLWVVHNVGAGPQWENVLFKYTITGHYRYNLD